MSCTDPCSASSPSQPQNLPHRFSCSRWPRSFVATKNRGPLRTPSLSHVAVFYLPVPLVQAKILLECRAWRLWRSREDPESIPDIHNSPVFGLAMQWELGATKNVI